jgi:hypothetical protein
LVKLIEKNWSDEIDMNLLLSGKKKYDVVGESISTSAAGFKGSLGGRFLSRVADISRRN